VAPASGSFNSMASPGANVAQGFVGSVLGMDVYTDPNTPDEPRRRHEPGCRADVQAGRRLVVGVRLPRRSLHRPLRRQRGRALSGGSTTPPSSPTGTPRPWARSRAAASPARPSPVKLHRTPPRQRHRRPSLMFRAPVERRTKLSAALRGDSRTPSVLARGPGVLSRGAALQAADLPRPSVGDRL